MKQQKHKTISESTQKYKQDNLEIGIGLNEVDNLKPSHWI